MSKLEIRVKVGDIEMSHSEEASVEMSSDYVINVTHTIVESIIEIIKQNDTKTKDTE